MGWEILDNIRGAKGDQGAPGAKGDKGDTGLPGSAGPIGPAGTIASADAESVPASENAAVIMSGSSEVKHAHFKVPRGLPGVNALENDAAVAAYVAAQDSATAGAMRARFAQKGTVPVSAADPEFGLVYDGVTNVTSQIMAAATAAAQSSGVVVLPPGVFVADELLLPAGVSLQGSGVGATTLKHTGVGSGLIRAQGAITARIATLTADAVKGATTLTLSTTSGIVAGDLITLSDGFSYTTTDASYKSGEMLRVKSVDSDSQVTVWGSVRGSWATVFGSYTVANSAGVAVVHARQGFALSGLTLVGQANSDAVMVRIEYVDGVSISDIAVRGGGAGIGIRTSRDVVVSGNTIRDLTDNVGAGVAGYGVYVMGPSENVVVTGNTFSRIRHGFTTMGTSLGMPHGVIVSGNIVSECTTAALDTHAAGESILLSGNIITSSVTGISIRSRRTRVEGNMLSGLTGHGINLAEENLADIAVTNNTIYGPNPGGHGIAAGIVRSLQIIGNMVFNAGADGISVNVQSSGVVIKGNTVVDAGASATGRSLIKSALTSGAVADTGTWIVVENTLRSTNATNVGRAIDLSSAGVTGATVARNIIVGAYGQAATVVLAIGSFIRENIRGDQAATTVSGSKGGNAALTSLLAALVANGVITDTTT